jgi:hypothetical protein
MQSPLYSAYITDKSQRLSAKHDFDLCLSDQTVGNKIGPHNLHFVPYGLVSKNVTVSGSTNPEHLRRSSIKGSATVHIRVLKTSGKTRLLEPYGNESILKTIR